MKTSLKILNTLFLSVSVISSSYAAGTFNMSDVMSTAKPLLQTAAKAQAAKSQADAAQADAQVQGQKEQFQLMRQERLAKLKTEQNTSSGAVKGFPMLDPNAAFLSDAYKQQRNAMFTQSMNAASQNYQRVNGATQAALAAEEQMTTEAMGAVSGVVGKLADQMNKNSASASQTERADFIEACAKDRGNCARDGKGNMVIGDKKIKIDDKLLADITAKELEVENGRIADESVSDFVKENDDLLKQIRAGNIPDRYKPSRAKLKVLCRSEPTTKACVDAISEAEKKAVEREKAEAGQDREANLIDGLTADIKGIKECNQISTIQASYTSYSVKLYLSNSKEYTARKNMVTAYTGNSNITRCNKIKVIDNEIARLKRAQTASNFDAVQLQIKQQEALRNIAEGS
ncbi:MAG: hypothetical protein COB02_05070 [Candidatus Cloacimonadota bacterium]|nr:MAG: hypothetical protein COB02_05070 [Candidatus Cloacimonadota bacterium]